MYNSILKLNTFHVPCFSMSSVNSLHFNGICNRLISVQVCWPCVAWPSTSSIHTRWSSSWTPRSWPLFGPTLAGHSAWPGSPMAKSSSPASCCWWLLGWWSGGRGVLPWPDPHPNTCRTGDWPVVNCKGSQPRWLCLKVARNSRIKGFERMQFWNCIGLFEKGVLWV